MLLPHGILLTRGNVADITAVATVASDVAPTDELVGNRGYNANWLRHFVIGAGLVSSIT
jgi:hypothetical protein